MSSVVGTLITIASDVLGIVAAAAAASVTPAVSLL